jgi:hypothetical protein
VHGARAAVVCLVATTILVPAAPSPADTARPVAARKSVLHRVVWDQTKKKGTHLWSANPDGSDPRRIYVRRTGFVTDIALNRQGTEAAVAPAVPSAERAALIVVDVLGRFEPENLLADHPEVRAVTTIGWSPDGRALVFEGAVGRTPHDLSSYLFKIDRDGGRLRRLQPLGRIEDRAELVQDTPLAWTEAGIFHYDERGLHRFRAGNDPVVLRGVVGQAVSGDGRWLYVERRHGRRYAMWRLHPDGTEPERLYPLNYPGYGYQSAPEQGYTYYWQPSYDGRTMLSALDGTAPPFLPMTIAHAATQRPTSNDPVLPFSTFGAITWN